MLQHLYLAGNYMGNLGVELLAAGLHYNDRVVDLDLANNDISGI
jgi:hypothetical protein